MTKSCFINARFLSRPITGVERYATELLKSLDSLLESRELTSEKISFVLIAPKNIKHQLGLKHISLKYVGNFSGHLWEQFELPFYTRGAPLVNLCNTAPLLKSNQLVTIHDAVIFRFPQAYSFVFRTWYKILWAILGITTKQVLTTSYFSKLELSKYCKISLEKLKVTYLGNEHILSVAPESSVLQQHELLNQPFVLAVSSLNPNKNFSVVVHVIERLGEVDFNFVIVGGANPKVFKRSQSPSHSNVKQVGYVSDAELRALYEHATCFIYPSFYEGFGLPPFEAMACGCPVIVSNAASLPEVCGDAALYCNPYSPDDIAAKICLLMADSGLREELRQKGLERAKQFSWEKCARETFAIIEKVLAS